jgi:hypothetical protein
VSATFLKLVLFIVGALRTWNPTFTLDSYLIVGILEVSLQKLYKHFYVPRNPSFLYLLPTQRLGSDAHSGVRKYFLRTGNVGCWNTILMDVSIPSFLLSNNFGTWCRTLVQLAKGAILLLLICFVRVRSILGPDIVSLFCGQRTLLNSSGDRSGFALIIILRVLMVILNGDSPIDGAASREGGCRWCIRQVRSWKTGWRRWRFIGKGKLHNLYSSPNIIRMIKSRRMKWVGNVARMGRRGMYIGYSWGSQKESDH